MQQRRATQFFPVNWDIKPFHCWCLICKRFVFQRLKHRIMLTGSLVWAMRQAFPSSLGYYQGGGYLLTIHVQTCKTPNVSLVKSTFNLTLTRNLIPHKNNQKWPFVREWLASPTKLAMALHTINFNQPPSSTQQGLGKAVLLSNVGHKS